MQPIEHVVVLMLENRSFDQMLGALQEVYPDLDGVDPSAPPRTNPHPSGTLVPQAAWGDAGPHHRVKPDPKHETHNVAEVQLAGGNQGFVRDYLASYAGESPDPANVMNYFPLGQLPALHELARNFTVCDHWFCSVPGPTWTNRFFVHSATSQGYVEMPRFPWYQQLHPYDQETIYERLTAADRDWRIYWDDFALTLLLGRLRNLDTIRHHLRSYGRFLDDVEDPASFPSYVFIEPNYLWPGQNDDHPPCAAIHGERLVAEVYNAIRGQEDLWRKTLLVVLFDEHGGFYDHVEPPRATPPGDNGPHAEYGFDRLGVRIPALLVSPWVEAGVYCETLDHTSLLRYLAELWDLGPPLTDRMRDANSIGPAIRTHGDPRSDTPPQVEVPLHRLAEPPPEKLTELQRGVVEASRMVEQELLRTRSAPLGAASAEEEMLWVRRRMERLAAEAERRG